ncbi:hypothetical protein PR048_010288 [Dryococelus australis]|uniref:HAT C-terminal dimerisation domain-containing protein n=1 Tax=Dryococelus australis TaxID=614101 RepID=A0ABQ9I2B7_9NEOP|nr:hypothetical protein PR048_010288 [Dryococelus australis]
MARICKPAAINEYGCACDEVSSELTEIKALTCVSFESTGSLHCSLLTHSRKVQFGIIKLSKAFQMPSSSRYDSATIARVQREFNVELLCDERKLFQSEKDKGGSRDSHIDVYWEQFLCLKKPSGDAPTYSTIAAVVRVSLALSHGQANVERSFSLSCQTLNCPHYVVMSKELLASAHSVHSKYRQHLEQEKERAMIEQQKKKKKKYT